MKKKILIGSIGAVVILLLAGITPVVLAQQTTKIIEKPSEVTIDIEEEQECSICPFSALSNEEIMDHFSSAKNTNGRIICLPWLILAFVFFALACCVYEAPMFQEMLFMLVITCVNSYFDCME